MENGRCVIAVIGNHKVGKSTVFNGLTGLCRHTGSWWGDDGKVWTGEYEYCGLGFKVVDWPGVDSLEKQELKANGSVVSCDKKSCRLTAGTDDPAGKPDVFVVVADATRLEQGLHLLKQVVKREKATERAVPLVLCVNFLDDALHKGMGIDFELLEDVLEIPVVPCCARNKMFLDDLKAAVYYSCKAENRGKFSYDCLDFSPKRLAGECVSAIPGTGVRRVIADSILTSPVTGRILMLFLLAGVLRLAMAAAVLPSQAVWEALAQVEGWLYRILHYAGIPAWLSDCLLAGGFRALSWTVAVMLPPLAVFIFCFTLLEEWGVLPRVSYGMDPVYERCGGCGGQCLTMALGLGCNAAGVACCKSIRSPRERLVAVLTNTMIPCCGRFPVFTALIPLFFAAGPAGSMAASLSSALFFAILLLIAVYSSMGMSWLLSRTLLRDHPSAFTLELPPYRRIRIGGTLVRSLVDRTLVLVERAVKASVPAGMIVWLLAHAVVMGADAGVMAGGMDGYGMAAGAGGGFLSLAKEGGADSLLALFSGALNPAARVMGMDGAILAAFILAFPASELILPILIMIYMQGGNMAAMGGAVSMQQLLAAHGWTWTTALCTLVFAIFHWPCLTTCRAVARETKGWKWAAAAVCISTAPGILLCLGIALCSRMLPGI